jgi:hypothetical protein
VIDDVGSEGACEPVNYRYLAAYPLCLALLAGVVFGGVLGAVKALGLREDWVPIAGGPPFMLISIGFCWFAWGPNGRWVDRHSLDQ